MPTENAKLIEDFADELERRGVPYLLMADCSHGCAKVFVHPKLKEPEFGSELLRQHFGELFALHKSHGGDDAGGLCCEDFS